MATVTYKCPNCGAPLEFNAESQNWTCDFCDSEFTAAALEAHTEQASSFDYAAADDPQTGSDFSGEILEYACPNCGARILTDKNTSATFCLFCHSPAILSERLTGEFRPSAVSPFQMDKQAATTAFLNWCKRKPLVPKDFKSGDQLQKISGLYVPFWLFHCRVTGSIHARAQNIRSWTSGDYRYTETSHYAVSRRAHMEFNGIPADGSQKMDDSLMQTLEPYDYSGLQKFDMGYLSGYFSEKYDLNNQDVFPNISDRLSQYTESILRGTIHGYGSVTVVDRDLQYNQVHADYALLPVWMLTYQRKGKSYMFAMNGQTGKVAGRLPVSFARAAGWFLGIAAGLFALCSLIGGIIG